MPKIKIKDNSLISKYKLGEVNKITEKIADKTLKQLEKEGVFVFPEMINDAEDITKDLMILKSVNDDYRTSNVMGFLGYGDERIVIESRFSSSEHDFFFQYLLERVLDFPNILELNTDGNQDKRFFNLLVFLFPLYLKKAMRKGAFKTYTRNLYNDSNVKGTIDITRHIKNNTPFRGNIAYSKREFSFDNYLMQLIRHTIEFIKIKPYGNNLLGKVKDEIRSVVEFTGNYEYHNRIKIISKNKRNMVSHAYYHEYRELQRLCLMILRHDKHQIGTGERQIYGILFDGSWLWEEYISSLFLEYDIKFYHPMNKKGEGTQWLFTDCYGNLQGKIYPDFLSQTVQDRIIADAKYKTSNNIGNKDYLQLLAYMFRFDAKIGYYFYPDNKINDKEEFRMNNGSKYENNVKPRNDICVIKLGLQIPNDAISYDGNDGFVSKIKISETEFIDKILLRDNFE